MANRNDENHRGTENGVSGNNGLGHGTPSTQSPGATPGWSQTQGYGGVDEKPAQGRYFGQAMQRIGEQRGQRAPGEIGMGRGSGREEDEDTRARVTHPIDAPAGSYTSGSYGDVQSPMPGRREWYQQGSGSLRDTGTRVNRGDPAETYDAQSGIGGSIDRYGPTPSNQGGEVRSRWLKEPLAAHDVMTRNPRTVRRDTTLRDASMLMRDEDTGILPVVDAEGRLVGVLTDRDMVVRAFAFDKVPAQMRVEDVMSKELECVMEDESVRDILELMGKKQIRRVPVVDRDDRLIGIISLGDIAKKADADEELQETLHRISMRRSFWSRMFR